MDEERTVWCGNLSDKVTEDVLYELFLQVAPLQRVNIPQDKEGRKSNFGFIVFKHTASVNYATELLNGTNLFEKPLNIKPRSRNQGNDNRSHFRDSPRRNDKKYNHDPPVQNSEPFFDNLLQMAAMMNASAMQPTYSSSVDRRQNNFMESRRNNFIDRGANNFNEARNNRNFGREERKPYSRNNSRHGKNNNRNFERKRYY